MVVFRLASFIHFNCLQHGRNSDLHVLLVLLVFTTRKSIVFSVELTVSRLIELRTVLLLTFLLLEKTAHLHLDFLLLLLLPLVHLNTQRWDLLTCVATVDSQNLHMFSSAGDTYPSIWRDCGLLHDLHDKNIDLSLTALKNIKYFQHLRAVRKSWLLQVLQPAPDHSASNTQVQHRGRQAFNAPQVSPVPLSTLGMDPLARRKVEAIHAPRHLPSLGRVVHTVLFVRSLIRTWCSALRLSSCHCRYVPQRGKVQLKQQEALASRQAKVYWCSTRMRALSPNFAPALCDGWNRQDMNSTSGKCWRCAKC